jgi:DNA ligase (NAD+)
MIIMFWTPIISDFEFDLKLKELQELENKYPEYFDESSLRSERRLQKILKLFPT